MEGGDGEGAPPAKRQKVAKLPGGQYYPEQDWINLHPVRCCTWNCFSSC
jgi:splicing factor 3A subunit 1